MFDSCSLCTHQQTPESKATFLISDCVFAVQATVALSHRLHGHVPLCISTQRLHRAVAAGGKRSKAMMLIRLVLLFVRLPFSSVTTDSIIDTLSLLKHEFLFSYIKLKWTRYISAPVSSLDASYIDAEVLTLLHRDHLRCWFKTEFFHHGLEVVLPRTLTKEEQWLFKK